MRMSIPGMRVCIPGMTLSVYEYEDEDEYTWDDTVCI